jgi:hypothetical protein
MVTIILKNNFIFFIAVFIFLVSCTPEPGNKPKRHYTIIQRGSMRESVGANGEHLQGQMNTEYIGNEGSFTMESTAEDYHYKDITTFEDGSQRISETFGDR